MSLRLRAAVVIAKRRIFESFLNPGYYIAQAVGLLLSYILISGFVSSIDSSGLNYMLHPLYEFIGRLLSGAFGITFLEKLFAEGPFQFVSYVSFVPIFIYLSFSTVFRFSLEKKVGAIELLAYGPVDGTSCFLAFYIKDIILTIFYLLFLILFLIMAALLNNLVLGPAFLYTLVVTFFMAMLLYSISILASVLTDSGASAMVLYIGIILFLLIVIMGSFTIGSAYVRSFSSVLSWLINWFSPFFYWGLALSFLEVGNMLAYFLILLVMMVLSGLFLFLSHQVIKIRGVRP
ncbi:MAG: hypothetical protein KAQ69_01630 [Spirochaetales bacterium]|nr:hypothetical protein [Spirochaetales bacterium]